VASKLEALKQEQQLPCAASLLPLFSFSLQEFIRTSYLVPSAFKPPNRVFIYQSNLSCSLLVSSSPLRASHWQQLATWLPHRSAIPWIIVLFQPIPSSF